MTSAMLLRALCRFLRQTVDDYAAAQGKEGEYRTPEVYEWYLPFRDGRNQPNIDFPYIVARIINGEDPVNDSQSPILSTVRIDLSFGVYNEAPDDDVIHPDGAYDLLNLMEHVRIALFRQLIIDGRYKIEQPYKWHIPDEQPYPLWVGVAQSIWTVQRVTPQYKEGFLHGGFEWERE